MKIYPAFVISLIVLHTGVFCNNTSVTVHSNNTSSNSSSMNDFKNASSFAKDHRKPKFFDFFFELGRELLNLNPFVRGDDSLYAVDSPPIVDTAYPGPGPDPHFLQYPPNLHEPIANQKESTTVDSTNHNQTDSSSSTTQTPPELKLYLSPPQNQSILQKSSLLERPNLNKSEACIRAEAKREFLAARILCSLVH